MSGNHEEAAYYAEMMEDLARGIVEDISKHDHDSAGGALDELLSCAGHLLRSLEDAEEARV